MEYVDAETTVIQTSHELTCDADVPQLIQTEQHRQLKERTRLLVRHPEAKIELSRPTGYRQLLETVEAHAYELSHRVGALVVIEDATAHWSETTYLPAVRAAGLPDAYAGRLKGDIHLWVHTKRRQLQTTDRRATWADAATRRAPRGSARRDQQALTRERRRPSLDGMTGHSLTHLVERTHRITQPQTASRRSGRH